MKITADRTRCQGHAMCEALLPHIFEVDNTGKVRILTTPIPTPDHSDARLAIDTCPVEALRAEA
ncbi:ferredoxin [Nocardia sp. NPDC050630]|uniref:ferredoxin n=1 Tax=Nocardia sp. NPDC050630 TaxID=3364321 RepID=UPI003795428B